MDAIEHSMQGNLQGKAFLQIRQGLDRPAPPVRSAGGRKKRRAGKARTGLAFHPGGRFSGEGFR